MPFCLPFSPRAFWGVNLVFCSFCFMASHRGGNFSAIKMPADTLTFSFFYSFHWFCNVVKYGFPLLTYRLLLTGCSWLSFLPPNWQVTICLFMLNFKKNYFWIYMPNWLKNLYRIAKVLNFLSFFCISVASMVPLAATTILTGMVCLQSWNSLFLISDAYMIYLNSTVDLNTCDSKFHWDFCAAINPPAAALGLPIVASPATNLNIGVVNPAASIYQTIDPRLAQPTVNWKLLLLFVPSTPTKKKRSIVRFSSLPALEWIGMVWLKVQIHFSILLIVL